MIVIFPEREAGSGTGAKAGIGGCHINGAMIVIDDGERISM
jgi:hypothetical protein